MKKHACECHYINLGQVGNYFETLGIVFGFCLVRGSHCMRVLIQWRLETVIVAVAAFVADQFGEMLTGGPPVLFHVVWVKNHPAVLRYCSVL